MSADGRLLISSRERWCAPAGLEPATSDLEGEIPVPQTARNQHFAEGAMPHARVMWRWDAPHGPIPVGNRRSWSTTSV